MPLKGREAMLVSFVVYVLAVLALAVFMLALSALLGERRREKATEQPYESGVASCGTARMRFDVKFYLVAMFFVVFDLEAVFIFAWARIARLAGWAAYGEIAVFIFILAAGLFYLWRVGALDWGPLRGGSSSGGCAPTTSESKRRNARGTHPAREAGTR